MNATATAVPTISIVMPVYDTGRLLLDSVRSIVDQSLFVEEGAGDWELLIVDDASNDPATIAALDEAKAMSPRVRVLKNKRSKGVAGARNTGIFASQGEWIGFLDSDDLWYPNFLRDQRDCFADRPEASWRAAHFDVGDDAARTSRRPLSQRSPCLYRHIGSQYVQGRVSTLRRPVGVLIRCGCLQVMTVQVRREIVMSLGGFDEALPCAEDYDLWLRLANVCDLHIAPVDAGVYRLRDGSLSRAGQPMYYCEDRMLLGLNADPAFASFNNDIAWRLRKVYSSFCFHFRANGKFGDATRTARALIGLAPASIDGWRHLAASTVRRR